jgi:LPXTG-motif cell wall-anchored protein
MKPWKYVHSFRKIAVVAATLAVVVSGIPAAQAATEHPRTLAVSVPSEPARLASGATGTVPIRVVNPGPRPVVVKVASQRVTFGDEGRVTIAGRDPMWAGRVDFPFRPLTISAQSYRDIGLSVHMPARIRPDLYFIGFLVTPLPDAAGNVTYVNQIGSYITIDVPGPRARTLAADMHLPSFAFTNHLHASLHVHNVGAAAVMYWGENDTTANPGSSPPHQARIDRSLLPAGRSRTITVDAKPSFLIAFVTVHVHITYPGRTDAATTEILFTKRVLIVQPGALLLLGAMLIGAGFWAWRRRKRRTQHPRRPRRDRSVTPARIPSRERHSPSRGRRVRTNADAAARLDVKLAQARANSESNPRARPHA